MSHEFFADKYRPIYICVQLVSPLLRSELRMKHHEEGNAAETFDIRDDAGKYGAR
jgi:hypothetical protein